jgi:hypothetical protein
VPDTGLPANTICTYQIIASNSGGQSPASNLRSCSTLPNPPNTPTSLVAKAASQTTVNVTWQDTNADFVGFVLMRQTGASPYQLVAITGATTMAYQDSNLAPNTIYTYQVFAVANFGVLSAGSNLCSTTTLAVAPAAPTGLTATVPAAPAGQSEIDLKWTNNSTTAVGFIIQRRPGTSGSFVTIGTVAATTTTFADVNDATNPADPLNKLPNTQYSYQVLAVNSGGQIASNIATAATLPAAPLAPSQLAGTLTGTTATLTWVDNNADFSGFTISRTDSNGTTIHINVSSTSRTYKDTLVAGITYTYTITASNGGGVSPASNAVTVSP